MYLDILSLLGLGNTGLVIILLLSLFGIYIRKTYTRSHSSHRKPSLPPSSIKKDESLTDYPLIEPLPSFNWETTEPLVFWPFKPKYHLTMAISHLDPSSLIPMDKTYKERLALRASLLKQYPDVVRAVNKNHERTATTDRQVSDAVCEYYTFLMGTYLPTRYPTMFELDNKDKQNVIVKNKVTGLVAPVDPPCADTAATISLLDTLAAWIDEDFLILLPESESQSESQSQPASVAVSQAKENIDKEQDEKYILQAYNTYYPAGFDSRTKLGNRLADIHAPVPGYKEKLEKSMDRFFAKLEVGRFVQRVNWSISTGRETGLFAAFGGLHGDGKGKEEEQISVDKLDVESTVVRCERQTLHRLPKTKALVFAFHTYTYPIQSIKDEGLGEDLALAIDGLKLGSVPGIHRYKRGSYWGEAVKAFLRS